MHRVKTSLLPWLFYFACLLAIGLGVRDVAKQPDLAATVAVLLQGVSGMHDPTSFATGALDVYLHGWFTPTNAWLIHLWPPGFMLLEGMILKVGGQQAPLVGVLMVLAAMAHAAVLSFLRLLLRPLVAPFLALLLPLVPFAFPVVRLFLLEPMGLALGETFSVASYLGAVLLMLLALRERRLAWAGGAGVLLALCSYFRSQYEVFVLFTTLGAVPLCVWLVVARSRGEASCRAQALFSLKAVLLMLATAHALMLPWRVHNLVTQSSPTWVQTQTLVAISGMRSDAELFRLGGGFIVQGGGNMACRLVPEYCGQTDPRLFYRAFFTHPIEWIRRKSALLDDYWFAAQRDWCAAVSPAGFLDVVPNLINLGVLLALGPLLWWARRGFAAAEVVWLCGSLFLGHAAIFTLAHFETRYFYLMKIFVLVLALFLGAVAWQQRRSAALAQDRERATQLE